MRIRSIKPEFWRSDDMSALPIEDRLLFIGLWSYVDDSGIGLDQEVSIAADLFAADLSCNPHETLARVSRGMQHIAARGCIVRWKVDDPESKYDGKHLFKIAHWSRHQNIARPSQGHMYPKPPANCMSVSCNPHETPVPGTGEQGNRGTVTPSLRSGVQGGDVHDDPAAGCGSGSHVVADAPTAPAEAKPKRKVTGTRLPDGWFPSRTDANLRTERESGLTDRELQDALDNFRDYWAAQPGQRGRKADWDATWRNWVRRVSKQHHPRRQDQTTQILADAMARANAGINVFKEAS